MKKRHPVVSGLVTLGYTVGGIVVLLFLVITFIVIFDNQSDEAWNAGIMSWFLLSLFAFPVGVLLAIGSYFKARRAGANDTLKEQPIQTSRDNARDVT